MERGDFKNHLYRYEHDGIPYQYGLVCWKDSDMVYAMSNETNTRETDVCYRRSKDGLVSIPRPKMISEYNKHMGGVDLEDMRRVHFNSTIMGHHRWWLKLFFTF